MLTHSFLTAVTIVLSIIVMAMCIFTNVIEEPYYSTCLYSVPLIAIVTSVSLLWLCPDSKFISESNK